jgi:hypothetical protein
LDAADTVAFAAPALLNSTSASSAANAPSNSDRVVALSA